MPKFSISRSIVVQASTEQVYKALSDFSTWTTWSPWLIAEPEAKVTISSDPASVGSTYHWVGQVTGEGKMQIRKLQPQSRIEIDLNFLKPFKSYADVWFDLEPSGQGTKVTWAMNSGVPFFLFFMVPMFKTFIGMDYARGLTMFKEYIETGSVNSISKVHGVERTRAIRMLGIASSCPVDQVSISMDKAFSEAQSEFKRLGIQQGEMISVYTKFRIKEAGFDYISGYIVPETIQLPTGSKLTSWSAPSGSAFRVEHVGGYKHLGNPWSIANQLARYKKLKQSKVGTYEIYRVTPPAPEHELVTDIYLPLK